MLTGWILCLMGVWLLGLELLRVLPHGEICVVVFGLHTGGRSFLGLVFVAWSTEKIPGFFFFPGVAAGGPVHCAVFNCKA